MNENENKILDNENSESQENNWDNKSVGESITRLRFDLAEEEWFENTEKQKINLKKNNSSKHLPIDFSSLLPKIRENVWDNCVSSFNFEEFGDRLMLAEISAKNIPAELMNFKSKIIRSVLMQNGYFINKKKLENVPADDSFFVNVINYCIDFPSRENFYNDYGNKITTLIKELSKWMKDKKLSPEDVANLVFSYYSNLYDDIVSKNLKLDNPLLSLDNLKKITLCIDFNQNENIDWYCNEIYHFFNLVCHLLIGMKQGNGHIKVYIANLFSYLGYKTEGIENVENQPEFLSKLPAAKEFYENAKKSKAGLELLRCIKSLGFTLILDKNETFKLEKVDEVDKLIASIEYCNNTELNNWVKGVNTLKEKNRNKYAGDENANDNYLKIESFDDFKNMKKNSILSFIENSKNANELKKKYQILLEDKNQDRLNEVILNIEIVDWMLHNLKIEVFEGEAKDVQNVIDIVKKFYQYTDKPNAKISPLVLVSLLSSFKENSLTNYNINLILEINEKNDGYELKDEYDKKHISYLFYVLCSLKDKQGIPEKLITLITSTIDFELTDLNNYNDRGYFYGILFFLIRYSKAYDENNPKEAIEDVFNGKNKILNELLKIQNAKDYLNIGVMQKEKNFGSKLADLFVKSGLKISFEAQEKNQINKINENKINKNADDKIEDDNESDEENDDEDDLKFELKEMNEIDKLIIELSKDENLNKWVKGVNTFKEENRNENAKGKNANDNYLKIESFDDFKNMKKNSIVSFIEKSENANELKDKYQVLLEEKNKNRLDEVILNKNTVDWMLSNLETDIFEAKDVQDVIDIIKKFYKYTDEPNAKISSLDLMFLLSSFKEESLTNDKINLILEINGKEDGYELKDGYGKKHISYLCYVLRSLKKRQGIPEKLITLITSTTDFESTDLDNDRCYFYSILFFLIRCSGKYNENCPKEAIEDVFNGKNKILNELLKIQNAKDYLNIGVMQKEKNFGSKLADLFVKSGLKISFEAQEKNQINKINENKINENADNEIENNNESDEENDDEDDLKFELKEMNEIDKLIIELSKDENLNNWVKGVNTRAEEDRNKNAGDENAQENYSEIERLDDFENMKNKFIVSFIEKSKNANELKKKYQILLEEKNKNRLDEVILDVSTVDWMLQNVKEGIFNSNDFDKVTEVVKKFYQYNNEPNNKARPNVLMCLLVAFKKNSLTTKQMCKVLEMNDCNVELVGALSHPTITIMGMLSVLKNGERIPVKLFDLFNQIVDFNSIDLDSDGETEALFHTITCLIEHSEKYDPENVSEAINDIFGDQVDDISEESQVCRKFVRESLWQIPSGKERINKLLEISQKPDYEKKLIKMFTSDGISKITIEKNMENEEENEEEEEDNDKSKNENNDVEIKRCKSLKLKSNKNLFTTTDIEDQNQNFDTKSVKSSGMDLWIMDINKQIFNIDIDKETEKAANKLEQIKAEKNQLKNLIGEKERQFEELKNLNKKLKESRDKLKNLNKKLKESRDKLKQEKQVKVEYCQLLNDTIDKKAKLAEELKNSNDKSKNESKNNDDKIKTCNKEYNIIQNKTDENLKNENTNPDSELEAIEKETREALNKLEQAGGEQLQWLNNMLNKQERLAEELKNLKDKNKIDSQNTIKSMCHEFANSKKRKAMYGKNRSREIVNKMIEGPNIRENIINTIPQTQNKYNKKLEYTLYIFSLIITLASVVTGFYISYAFLGLLVSLILLFIVCCLKSKSQEEKNFKSINNNLFNISQTSIVKQHENIINDYAINNKIRNDNDQMDDIFNKSF